MLIIKHYDILGSQSIMTYEVSCGSQFIYYNLFIGHGQLFIVKMYRSTSGAAVPYFACSSETTCLNV